MRSKKFNAYQCDKCQGVTTTEDIDDGVTPAMIGCDKSCGGTMFSKFYNLSSGYETKLRLIGTGRVWRKPTKNELRKLSAGTKDHVSQGGLLLAFPDGGLDE